MPDNPCPLCLRTGEHHPGCPAANPPVPDPPPALWGVVEKMGHKVLAGRITEEERFGGTCGRVDVPQADGTFVTHYFTAQSIYGLTYCSEAAARVRAAKCDVAPVQSWDLPQRVKDAMAAAGRQVRALGVAGDPPPGQPPYHGGRTADEDARPDDYRLADDDEELDDAGDIRF